MNKNYIPKISIKDTQFAIEDIKNYFQKLIKKSLKLTRVTAPLFLDAKLEVNDNLTGVEPSVKFHPKHLNKELEIVQSLAKWKRIALKKYEFKKNEGIYTDMNAIRANEVTDYCHSIYVDQWDWELVISKHNYNLNFLYKIVEKFYKCLLKLEKKINSTYLDLTKKLPKKIYFITSKELYDLYPNVSSKERENLIAKEHKAVFISQIGDYIENTSERHDLRAKDYDNWSLNGDLIVYHEQSNKALELMSLGIRVDADSLIKQANLNVNEKENLPLYYQMILNNQLPLTIGGGLGQSRLCMFLLEKEHIGEVQVSVWTDLETENNKFIL